MPQTACVGPPDRQFFMGGVAMGTAVDALERTFGKPLLWAATQFLNHAFMGEDLRLEVVQEGGGKSVVQASARLCRGDQVLQHTRAALGRRECEPDRQFVEMPNAKEPHEGTRKTDNAYLQPGNFLEQFERRAVLQDRERGIDYAWTKTAPFAVDAAILAIVSDFYMGAHPRGRGGTSLDNTIRICALKPTEWVLSVTQVSAFSSGTMQGSQHHFAQDGTLLAVSSQTGLLPYEPNP